MTESSASPEHPSSEGPAELVDELALLREEPDEEGEDDLVGLTAEAVSEAVVTGTDWTTETMLSQLRRGTIDLDPRFQRRDAWTDQRKSAFIESIFLGLPIPQLVLAEQEGRRGYFLVIDGKQRLLALQRFAAPDSDIPPLVLSNLIVRRDLNGLTFEDLTEDPKYRDDLAAFDNHPIRTVVVRNWPNEKFLYLVFHRLNSGSLPLSPQELRQALLPGPFVDFVQDFSEESAVLHRALRIQGPDFRMRDVELLIRYFGFAYFLEDYRGNLKDFLDQTCRSLNAEWPNLESEIRADANRCIAAIEVTETIFGSAAFRRWDGSQYQGRFNRAVFDIMTYYFRDGAIAEQAVQREDRVRDAFVELSGADEAFSEALQTTTKTITATARRLSAWGEALQSATELDFPIPQLDESNVIRPG